MMQEVELGSVCKFENGDRGKNYPSRSAFVDYGIPFINAGNLDGNKIKKEGLNYITKDKYDALGSGKLQVDDILFCLRGSLGKFALNEDGIKGAIASSLVLLRVKEDLNIKYLYHYLNSPKVSRLIQKSDNGSSQPNLSASNVKKFPIPLPPLPQQKKIAAILDAADAYRRKTQALIAKYEELTQSLFLEMFGDPVRNPMGWEKKRFLEMAEFDTHMTKDFEQYGDLLHVGIGNIEKNTGKIYGCLTAKEENLTSGKYLFTEEHIIYSKIRPNLNKVALPDFKGLCSADAYPIKAKCKTTNRLFLAFLLRSECFLDFILQHSTRTNIPKANKAQMKLFEGIAPPLTLQNQFADRVQAIEAQKAQAQASLTQAENLFNSLLQKAFKGELT